MSTIDVVDDAVELDAPTLVEGLPGLGLVGKIATDHLIEELDMTYFAALDCEGVPQISVYEADDRTLRPPVRFYADEERNLVALRSDVPISVSTASEFAGCITGWVDSFDATPLYLSGLPRQKKADQVPKMYGVATGDAGHLLDEHDIGTPRETGAVSGPTGALLHQAGRMELDSVGLIVQSDAQFPDPEAARVLIKDGIAPIAGIEVDTDDLVDRAEDIRQQKEELAQRMQQAEDEESSQARPLRMFH
ncbi:proteasome assembly chaperone family protein [Haladaptatus sp. NG-WS-4]